ncbi:MAG: prepilin-type N-terminal cleavage/methylation domain-containing protein, partial [Pseudoxanthomonas sp.]
MARVLRYTTPRIIYSSHHPITRPRTVRLFPTIEERSAMKKNIQGFTLIELMIVVAIIAILAAIA